MDGTIGTVTGEFEKKSKITERVFDSKPWKVNCFTFAGIEIELLEGGNIMRQRVFACRII